MNKSSTKQETYFKEPLAARIWNEVSSLASQKPSKGKPYKYFPNTDILIVCQKISLALAAQLYLPCLNLRQALQTTAYDQFSFLIIFASQVCLKLHSITLNKKCQLKNEKSAIEASVDKALFYLTGSIDEDFPSPVEEIYKQIIHKVNEDKDTLEDKVGKSYLRKKELLAFQRGAFIWGYFFTKTLLEDRQ